MKEIRRKMNLEKRELFLKIEEFIPDIKDEYQSRKEWLETKIGFRKLNLKLPKESVG